MNTTNQDSDTITNPPLNLTIDSVSKIVLKHMHAYRGSDAENSSTPFDIDLFVRKEYQVKLIPRSVSCVPTLFSQETRVSRTAIPTYENVKKFLNLIFDKLKLNVECGIVGLIYIERLMNDHRIPLTKRNWRCCLIAAILTASKVWDDLASWNIEFAELFPINR
eukprot:UN31998